MNVSQIGWVGSPPLSKLRQVCSASGQWCWTRFGYSYDWGNPKNPVGLSEFVIRIDPNKNGGEITVKLEKAYDCETPDWPAYYRCHPETGRGDRVP